MPLKFQYDVRKDPLNIKNGYQNKKKSPKLQPSLKFKNPDLNNEAINQNQWENKPENQQIANSK